MKKRSLIFIYVSLICLSDEGEGSLTLTDQGVLHANSHAKVPI